jgi:hypothetical protein
MGLPPRNYAISTPYAFGGGLDQASASLAVPGGRVIAGLNYEPVVNGYRRVQGHERTDGRLPSSLKSIRLNYTGRVGGGFFYGMTITGATSGATAIVLQMLNDAGGAGTLAITNITGTFVNGEVFSSGVRQANANGAVYTIANDPYDSAAANWLRALIQTVPGSGPVRGGFVFNGVVYAVRDNAGATLGIIYKATSAGWVAQSFGRTLSFRLGLVAIAEGSTITGATSGATAHVERVIVQTGAWGAALPADQAVGYLVLSGQAGVFVVNEVLKVGATNVATNNQADSLQAALPPGGRYHCKVKNFYGAVNRKRVYLANGVGVAWEYDGGSVIVPILTGTPTDTPTRVFDIANALGLVFPGGSIQISEPGEPCVFNAILGALEIALGDDVTDVIDSNDSAVVFFAKEKVAALTGRGVDTFVLEEVSEEAGALPWTVQRIGRTVYLDRRGMRDLTATAAFGDFKTGALSELFDRYLDAKRRAGATPVASLRSKTKSQYRVYYSDGTGFTVYMGRKNPEMLPFQTDALRVYATFSGELADGSEGLFACGQDGYLYRLDSGVTFDGVAVRAFVMLPFNHLGNIGLNKRFHGVTVELDAANQTRLGVVAQFDYGDGEQPISGNQDFSSFTSNDFTITGGGGDFILTSGGGVWDAATWGQFYWSTAYQGMAEADIAGAGRNISLIIASPATDIEAPHTLQSYAIRWSPRGQVNRTAQ